MKFKHLALACVATGLLSVGAGVSAASIAGDAFEASLTVDGTISGPFSGVAGSGGDDIHDTPSVGFDGLFRVEWIDDDSVDVEFFIGGLGHDLTDASFTLSGLNFKSSGEPRDIIGVTFNRAASNVDSFNAGFSLVGPILSFTSTSVTGVLSMSEELVADGPRLRYDVIAVPEPATLPLVLIFTKAVGKGSIEHGVRVLCMHPPATRTDRIVQLYKTSRSRSSAMTRAGTSC